MCCRVDSASAAGDDCESRPSQQSAEPVRLLQAVMCAPARADHGQGDGVGFGNFAANVQHRRGVVNLLQGGRICSIFDAQHRRAVVGGKAEFFIHLGISDSELISILATLENKSEHPIAHAITTYAKQKSINLLSVKNFESIKGKGVQGTIEGIEYFVGGAPIALIANKETLATVTVADAIKPEAVQAVKDLHALGIKVIMATGDSEDTAHAIAREVGIDEVIARIMPQDKLQIIKDLQEGRFENWKLSAKGGSASGGKIRN